MLTVLKVCFSGLAGNIPRPFHYQTQENFSMLTVLKVCFSGLAGNIPRPFHY